MTVGRLWTTSSAVIDPTKRYRYELFRGWDESLPSVCFIMLNPSTADASVDDPTIRRCIRFAKDWGKGGMYVVNLFGYRSSSPGSLHYIDDPVGPENDKYLLETTEKSDLIVGAWGSNGDIRNRSAIVLQLLSGKNIYHLGLTSNGQPRHPLYLAQEAELQPYVLNTVAEDKKDGRSTEEGG